MDLIKSINSRQLNDLIQSASERLILSLPGLFEENTRVIILKYQEGFRNIKVILNCSEQIIRQGYGEIDSIRKLKEAGIPIFDQPENLVSFIITANKGYFLFPQSRIFLEESHNVRNAIEMDPVSMEQIIAIFFPPAEYEKKQLEDKLANAQIQSHNRVKNIDQLLKDSVNNKVFPINNEIFNSVKKNIDANPPLHPDRKRKLDYYTTNFLWIKLKFKGANILNKTITIPDDLISIDSEEFRKKIYSHLKLFEKLDDSIWYLSLIQIKREVEELRKKHLSPIREKDGMNIILKKDYNDFDKSYNAIKDKIDNISTIIPQKINEEILDTREKFRKILIDHYQKNPTPELKNTKPEYLQKNLEILIDLKIKAIHFPNADELFSKFSIDKNEFELTPGDLDNEKLIQELSDKNLLSKDKVDKIGSKEKGFATLFDDITD